jgi:hypothetical protein
VSDLRLPSNEGDTQISDLSGGQLWADRKGAVSDKSPLRRQTGFNPPAQCSPTVLNQALSFEKKCDAKTQTGDRLSIYFIDNEFHLSVAKRDNLRLSQTIWNNQFQQTFPFNNSIVFVSPPNKQEELREC